MSRDIPRIPIGCCALLWSARLLDLFTMDEIGVKIVVILPVV